MANTWDQLDNQTKMQLARQAVVGSKNTPENINRAMDALSKNPEMVNRMMQESGVVEDDADLRLVDSEVDDSSDNEIEDAVERSLSEDGSSDIQATGKVANKIPPPEEGETTQQYAERLMSYEISSPNGARGFVRRGSEFDKHVQRMRPGSNARGFSDNEEWVGDTEAQVLKGAVEDTQKYPRLEETMRQIDNTDPYGRLTRRSKPR